MVKTIVGAKFASLRAAILGHSVLEVEFNMVSVYETSRK